jgi:hypothetical protein
MFGLTEKLPEPAERVALTLELAISEGVYRSIPGGFWGATNELVRKLFFKDLVGLS